MNNVHWTIDIDFHGAAHTKAKSSLPTCPPSMLPIRNVVGQDGRGGFAERKSTLCPPCLAVACPRQTHLCRNWMQTILVDKALPASASPNPRLVGQEGSGGLWSGQEVWGCSISSCPHQSLKNIMVKRFQIGISRINMQKGNGINPSPGLRSYCW